MVNFVIGLECFGICLTFVALILLLNGDGAREQKLLKGIQRAIGDADIMKPVRSGQPLKSPVKKAVPIKKYRGQH